MSATRSNPRKESPSRNNHVLRDSPKTADFDPRNMQTPLAVWCRSDLGAELNGTTVSKWLDMSGNGRDLSQSTAGLQPPFREVGQGQRPEFFFDDDKLTGSDFYAMIADKGEWAVFLVLGSGWADPNGVAASNFSNSINVFVANPSVGHLGIAQLSSTYGGFGGGIYAGGGYSGYRFVTTVTDSKISVGQSAIVSLYSNSSGITVRQNGVDGTTAAATDLISGASTMQLGDAPDNNSNALEYYYGPISELLIFDGDLQSYEIAQVEQYLSDRYDIGVR
tara:strand:- start:580 stop:1413 length:834 start_codon:yes stop_codon:yes gene_type:complete